MNFFWETCRSGRKGGRLSVAALDWCTGSLGIGRVARECAAPELEISIWYAGILVDKVILTIAPFFDQQSYTTFHNENQDLKFCTYVDKP